MRVKKMCKSIFALIFATALFLPYCEIDAASSYTYTYDYWKDERESPDAYSVTRTISGADVKGCGNFNDPQGLFVKDNMTYVVDSGHNRIVEMKFENDAFTFVKEIKEIKLTAEQKAEYEKVSAAQTTLKKPTDIFVTDNGEIFIADNQNKRIVHTDKDLNVIKIITRPVDGTVDQNNEFLPSKLVVDSSKRLFVNADNVNKGFMEFDDTGAFVGYCGANKVTYNIIEYLYKMVATKTQRDQMTNFVPTEYSNITLDAEGFIYATINTFDTDDLVAGTVFPVRKLNAKGTDILIRNANAQGGKVNPQGDLKWNAEKGDITGPSLFVDIVALENDVYYALDSARGRVFAYDFQGNLLYAFGGKGYRAGYFANATAIEDLNGTLLVLDTQLGTLTQFTLTEYGQYINDGLALYKKGDYEESAKSWENVLKLNGNYSQAYIGIGRAYLRQKKYKEAMDYFELKLDATNYSKAYKLYRKEWIEDHIVYIFGGLVIIIVFFFGKGYIKKVRREVKEG